MNAKSPNKTKHTPGPWHSTHAIVYNAQGWAVANATVFHGKHGADESTANAHLIASAPELLEALKDAEFLLRQLSINWKEAARMVDSCKRSASDARAAIAKAEGSANV